MTCVCVIAVAAVVAAVLIVPATARNGQTPAGRGIELVTLPVEDSPLVSIRLMFRAGSIHDPAGKEGLSAVTALMVGDSGTTERTFGELVEALYPMAARINVSADREVIVLAAQVHRDTLDKFVALFQEAVLTPGFRQEDFARHRDQLRACLTTTLPSSNDELLGLELVQHAIFTRHPYGHASAGTVTGLERLTLNDVKAFYREHYTQANAILGVAGGYPAEFPTALAGRLGALPSGTTARKELPAPPATRGQRFTIVEKPSDSVGIHFGYPLPITRADDDFYPLMVANSYLGEHRTLHGRLMQELRGKRGLNYGDYSYLEYWDNPPGTTSPTPNVPRRQQYFSVWIRPVAPDQVLFTLRAAIAEVNRLVDRGMTNEQFELTRDYLVSYSTLWARKLGDRLGFHMDSRFYQMPYFIDVIEQRLRALTVDDVNAAIRKYLQTANFSAVMIAGDAATLRERLRAGSPSPAKYPNPVAEDVTTADAGIVALPLNVASVKIVPVGETFMEATTPTRRP